MLINLFKKNGFATFGKIIQRSELELPEEVQRKLFDEIKFRLETLHKVITEKLQNTK